LFNLLLFLLYQLIFSFRETDGSSYLSYLLKNQINIWRFLHFSRLLFYYTRKKKSFFQYFSYFSTNLYLLLHSKMVYTK
jgi:hypothetical protein